MPGRMKEMWRKCASVTYCAVCAEGDWLSNKQQQQLPGKLYLKKLLEGIIL